MDFRGGGPAARRARLLVLAAFLMATCGIAHRQPSTTSSSGRSVRSRYSTSHTSQKSADSIHRVCDSKLGEDILARTERLGWKALAVYDYNGISEIMNDVRPVRTPADPTGLKIRALSPVLVGILKAWGANPVALLIDKVYSALLQHLVDSEIHSYALSTRRTGRGTAVARGGGAQRLAPVR